MSTTASDNSYGDAQLPSSPGGLADRFRELRQGRAQRKSKQRLEPKQPRAKLSRNAILEKTAGRCHICGGNIDVRSYWEADHVFPSSGGGPSNIGNYLPAHGLCNTAKWDRSGEELQWVLKVGVWAKKQMEGNSELGGMMLGLFWSQEQKRVKRQKAYRKAAAVV
jgi:hypothetical protein